MSTSLESRCSEKVFRDWHSSQCARKGVVEREGKKYCKQHDPEAIRLRREKADAIRKAQREVREASHDVRMVTEKTVAAVELAIELGEDVPDQIRLVFGELKYCRKREEETKNRLAELRKGSS